MWGKDRWWRIAIGHDDDPIVAFGLLCIVDDALKVGAAPSEYFYLVRCFLDVLYFASRTVELHHVDILDTIMEEAIDY